MKYLKKRKPEWPNGLLFLAAYFHTLCSILYFLLSKYVIHDFDAIGYYLTTLEGMEGIAKTAFGTSTVSYILLPLINYLSCSYFFSFILFGFLGFLGVLFFYSSLRSLLKETPYMAYLPFILFIPGIHFWSSAPGKDSMFMFATGLLLFSLLRFEKRWILSFLALTCMAMFRPHIAFFAFVSLMGALLWDGRIPLWVKTFFCALAALVLARSLAYIVGIAGVALNAFSIEKFFLFFEMRQNQFYAGGSTLDITQYPLPLKLFTYLCRPLFFDADSLIMFLASCENVIYVGMLASFFSPRFFSFLFSKKSLFSRFNLYYFVLMIFVLGLTTSNLGLSTRQKLMVIPSFISLFFVYKKWCFQTYKVVLKTDVQEKGPS